MVLDLVWMILVHSGKTVDNYSLSAYGFFESFHMPFVSKSLPFVPLIKSYSVTPGDLVLNHILLPTSTVYLLYVNHVEWNKIVYYFHVLLFGLRFIFLF